MAKYRKPWPIALNLPDPDELVFRRRRPLRNPMEDPLQLDPRDGPVGGRSTARDRVEFEPEQIRHIRQQFELSQRDFASMIGISEETLRNWERGRRCPQGPGRALLRIAAANPDLVASVLRMARKVWPREEP